MHRKVVFYSNKHERKNIADLSPRLAAKRPELVHEGPVISQASAQMKRRKPEAKIARLESPVYSRPKPELKKINQQKQLLSEQQIRGSALYKMLQQQIRQLARRQEQQLHKLKKIREQRRRESQTLKKQQFATKLQIWELKNQVFDIKELIQEEKNQSERLVEEIRPGAGDGGNGVGETQEEEQGGPELTENQEEESYETEEEN